MINSILTVCIGNICRSPMAEGILRMHLPELRVESAGIGALIGQPADQQARRLMEERKIDISGHVARQIDVRTCRVSDLILVMDLEQAQYIHTHFPFARGKVFRLAPKKDIRDPYRQDRTAFETALSLIEQGASSWVTQIRKISDLS